MGQRDSRGVARSTAVDDAADMRYVPAPRHEDVLVRPRWLVAPDAWN